MILFTHSCPVHFLFAPWKNQLNMTQILTLYSVDDLIKYFKIRNFREQKFRKFQKLQNFYILLTQSFIKQLKKVLLS